MADSRPREPDEWTVTLRFVPAPVRTAYLVDFLVHAHSGCSGNPECHACQGMLVVSTGGELRYFVHPQEWRHMAFVVGTSGSTQREVHVSMIGDRKNDPRSVGKTAGWDLGGVEISAIR